MELNKTKNRGTKAKSKRSITAEKATIDKFMRYDIEVLRLGLEEIINQLDKEALCGCLTGSLYLTDREFQDLIREMDFYQELQSDGGAEKVQAKDNLITFRRKT